MENDRRKPKAPGLKFRQRATVADIPYWFASSEAVKAGYPVKSVNLGIYTSDSDVLVLRCIRLTAEMHLWLSGHQTRQFVFDGTFGGLIELYLTDQDSSYRAIKQTTQKVYDIYARKLKAHIGARAINSVDGRDIKRWFDAWADNERPGDPRGPYLKLPRGRMMLAVLNAAIRFGQACRETNKSCTAFRSFLEALEFPTPRPRTTAPAAMQIDGARSAAHAVGRPRRALAYALQFETTARQWDITGQWVAISDNAPSSIIRGKQKWIGPTWGSIDSDMILTLRPTKTETTTDVVIHCDLKLCPMVIAEIARIPVDQRTGPLIVDEGTGLPYVYSTFNKGWRADFKAAGINPNVWNRDLRAGGITAGRMAGATREDVSKVAGHANVQMTARVYDRDTLEAHRRVAKARNKDSKE